MRWRRRTVEARLARAEREAAESRQRAEADLEQARQMAREAREVAERLRQLNASNGFAEMLMDAVVRGSM